MSTLQSILNNLAIWFVTPLIVFLFFALTIQYVRLLPQRLIAKLICWTKARDLQEGDCFIVVALPYWWSSRSRRRHMMDEMDTFCMAGRKRLRGPLLIMEKVKHEWRVTSRIKIQLANYYGRYQKGFFCWFFNWIGFTGAATASALRFYIYSIRREHSVLISEVVSGNGQDFWKASLRERMPTEARSRQLTWNEKIAEAKQRREKTLEKIWSDAVTRRYSYASALLIEEAIIAGSLADSSGEALRILDAISDPKSTEDFARQVPIAISHVYPAPRQELRVPRNPKK